MATYEEDDQLDDTDDLGGLGVGISSLSARAPRGSVANPGPISTAGAPDSTTPDFKAMLDRSYAGIAQRYKKAEELINQQYRGSSRNELLLSLGAALLKPTQSGKFRDSLANIPEALLGYVQGNRQTDRERASKLAELEIRRSSASELAPKDIYALMARYAPKTTLLSGANGIYEGVTQAGKPSSVRKLVEAPPEKVKVFNDTVGGGIKVFNPNTNKVEIIGGTGAGGLDLDPGLTGPAFLEALRAKSPADARAVEALLDGRGPPVTAYSSRNPKMARQIELAQQADPTFDVSKAAARRKTRQDYSPGGREGQKFLAANTVVGHLSSLAASAEKLGNTGIPFWNVVRNKALRETGDKTTQEALSRINQDIHAVAYELRRLFAQTGSGTLQELEAWEKSIANSSSPTEFKSAINEAMRLAKSRIDSSVDAYNQTMGMSVPYTHFLSKDAQRAIKVIAPDYFVEDTAPEMTAEGARAELERRKAASPAARVPAVPTGRIKVISVTPIGQ